MEKKSLNKQLVKASENHSFGKIRRLVKKGADPNTIINDKGRSAFSMVAWCGGGSTLKGMLEAGADLTNREEEHGLTPLLSACISGSKKTIEILLEAGSDTNEKDNHGRNGLILAVSLDHLPLIQFLCKKGFDINAQNDDGKTALVYFISMEEKRVDTKNEKKYKKLQSDIIKELLKYDADINKGEKSGHTALIHAVHRANLDIIKLLIDNGADINIRGKFGHTALTHAIHSGNLDITKFLFENGADKNAPKKNILLLVDDMSGKFRVKPKEMVALLKSYGAELNSYFTCYRINVNCQECGKLIPLNGPFQKLQCDDCLNVNELDDKFWTDIIEESTYSEFSIGDTCKVEYEISNPKCSECETELDVSSLNGQAHSEIVCKKCGQKNASFSAPDWFKKYVKHDLKPKRIICGESEYLVSDSKNEEIKPVAIRCISCAAALSIKVSTPRNCTCEHCGTVQYLPDPVWKALHPVKKRKDWYIYYSN